MKITHPRTTRPPLRTGGENKRTLSAGKVLLIALAAAAFSGLLAYKLTQTYFPTGFKTGLWTIAEELAIGQLPELLAGAVVVSLAIIAVALGLSWWTFRRQEL